SMETNKDILNFIKPKEPKELSMDFLQNLQQNVLKENELRKKRKVRRIIRLSTISIAASIAFLLFFLPKNNQSNSESKLNTEEILAYLEDEFNFSNTDVLFEFSTDYLN